MSSVLGRPPGPMSLPFFGVAGRFRRDPIGFLEETARTYGDVSHFRLRLAHVYFLNRPDLIEEVLQTHSGNFVDSAAFSEARFPPRAYLAERLPEYAEVLAAGADRMRNRWHEGQTVDVFDEMMRLTLGALSEVLLDTSQIEIGRALEAIGDRAAAPGGKRQVKRAEQYLQQCIEWRGVDPHVLAWREAAAATMTWALYLLSENADAEARMRDESGGRLPGLDDVAKLDFTRSVVAETLRLYPPAWAVARQSKDYMRLYNYAMPARSTCLMSPYVMHRHPRFWPEPERFEPGRFAPEQAGSRPKFAYFPFGLRTVVDGVAMIETVLVLAAVLQKWRLQAAPGQRIEPEAANTLRPKHGLRMVCSDS